MEGEDINTIDTAFLSVSASEKILEIIAELNLELDSLKNSLNVASKQSWTKSLACETEE